MSPLPTRSKNHGLNVLATRISATPSEHDDDKTLLVKEESKPESVPTVSAQGPSNPMLVSSQPSVKAESVKLEEKPRPTPSTSPPPVEAIPGSSQGDPFLNLLRGSSPELLLIPCIPTLQEVGIVGMLELRGLQAMAKHHRDDVFQELKRCGMSFLQVKRLEGTLETTFSAESQVSQ